MISVLCLLFNDLYYTNIIPILSIITMSDAKNDEFAKVYEKGLKFLNLRQHSIWEIKRKLTLRKFNQNLIDQAIEQFIESGYLNDENFAEIYLDSLIKYKFFGFYGLQAKLRQRGIAEEIIKRQLDEKFSVETEERIARDLVNRRKEKDKQKTAQALARKGFRTEVIRKIISNS